MGSAYVQIYLMHLAQHEPCATLYLAPDSLLRADGWRSDDFPYQSMLTITKASASLPTS